MKRFSIFRKAALIASVAVVLASCQKEELVIFEDDNSEISVKSAIEGCADQVLVIKTFETGKLQEAIESFGCNFNSLVIDSKTTLSYNDLYYAASLKLVSIDFSQSVFENNTIPEGPFMRLETSLIFPKSITKIACNAFYESSLKTIYLPNVTEIGAYAFFGCKNLSVVNLPRLTKVEEGLFSKCTGLVSVNLLNATIIETDAFNGAAIKSSVKLDNAVVIGERAFFRCSIKSISLPKATEIGAQAFGECTVSSYYLPKAAVIGDLAFTFGIFTSIQLPEATIIGKRAFAWNENLTSVQLPAAIEIGVYALDYCHNVTSLELGPKLDIIGDYLFGYPSSPHFLFPDNLTVTMIGTPPVISGYIPCIKRIRVPQQLMCEYEVSQWSRYNLIGY